jgi:D-glycero-D-manno-heptose 1,7-bisphosphate phosphatase
MRAERAPAALDQRMTAKRPGIILDRDGTLIDVIRDEETGVITVAWHPSQLRFLPGVLEGLSLLKSAGYSFAIATNQPGPAKGQFSVEAVHRTHHALVAALADSGITLSSVEVCWHHPQGSPHGVPELAMVCDCRKPAPGLLLRAMEHGDFDPTRTWMVGDSPVDVEAAQHAKLRSALVFAQNRCELCPLRDGSSVVPDLVAPTFDELARLIVAAPPLVS